MSIFFSMQLQSGLLPDSSAAPIDTSKAGIRGAITDRYQDYNRSQMLSAIAELEMVNSYTLKLITLYVYMYVHVSKLPLLSTLHLLTRESKSLSPSGPHVDPLIKLNHYVLFIKES